MPRQKLGQHFLADAGWREKIARAIGVSRHAGLGSVQEREAAWLEIGAGHGEMTKLLLATGQPVTAIELDPALVQTLEKLRESSPSLTVAAGDILKLDLAALIGERRVQVYGNLPYYIASPILHRLFEQAAQIAVIHVVVQLEVAARITASPGTREFGYLSVLAQYYSRPEITLSIPRGAFRPPPEVTSALVTLRLPGARASAGIRDEKRFLDFVKLCFAQKRKTLVNNLKPLAAPELVRDALAAAKIRADARAEQLSAAQFAGLYRRLIPE
jgi:16S rRNA (adenine1518-N6/adenine1519-N6)-dimethyltransferase